LEINALVVSPAFGVGTTDHADPSQDSARVFSPGPKKWPTAMQARPWVHDTDVRSSLLELATFGLGMMDHELEGAGSAVGVVCASSTVSDAGGNPNDNAVAATEIPTRTGHRERAPRRLGRFIPIVGSSSQPGGVPLPVRCARCGLLSRRERRQFFGERPYAIARTGSTGTPTRR
jgi:hypothetical protein